MISAPGGGKSASRKAPALPKLQRQMDQLDDWGAGLWLALLNLCQGLQQAAPEAMTDVLAKWSALEPAYDRLCQGGKRRLGEPSLGKLEPRVLLARTLQQLQAGPPSSTEDAADARASSRPVGAAGVARRAPARRTRTAAKPGVGKK